MPESQWLRTCVQLRASTLAPTYVQPLLTPAHARSLNYRGCSHSPALTPCAYSPARSRTRSCTRSPARPPGSLPCKFSLALRRLPVLHSVTCALALAHSLPINTSQQRPALLVDDSLHAILQTEVCEEGALKPQDLLFQVCGRTLQRCELLAAVLKIALAQDPGTWPLACSTGRSKL